MRKYLKVGELKALFNAAKSPRDRLIIQFMYETGLRVGEVVALKIGDVDFDLGEVVVRCGKWHPEGRRVPLVNVKTLAMLSEYVGDRMCLKDQPLFLTWHSRCYSREGIAHMVRKCGLRAGLDPDKCHVHTLRHTHAVHAIEAGVSLRSVQQNLGHSKIRTTAIYLTTDIEDRKEIYAAHPLPHTEGGQNDWAL